MYHSFLSPLVGQTGVTQTLRNFWLVFSILGVVTMFALIVYNRLFGVDTAETRARARRVMIFIYALLLVLAPGMVIFVGSTKGAVPPKTWIQAGIMFCVGIGGLFTLLRPVPHDETS